MDRREFDGKHVLVTGGTKGIGAAVAMAAGCPVQKRSAGQRRYRPIRYASAQPISTRDRPARGPAPSRGMTVPNTSLFITPCC